MALGGRDIYTLQKLMGHERPETTAIYLEAFTLWDFLGHLGSKWTIFTPIAGIFLLFEGKIGVDGAFSDTKMV